ncbi:hypothetical protein MNBD_ALPHA04-1624 [hydrothermal vent metagenome]|uniref:Uncharacterized protein n=1 Tax=hydrothermal vent metagenome TaxID=652676 RepID=A0A3B0SN40_9ZZZZ
MMIDRKQILAVTESANGFDFDTLSFSPKVQELIDINDTEFEGVGAKEIMFDGMQFLLHGYDTQNTQNIIASSSPNCVFCETPSKSAVCVGLSLGQHIIDAPNIGRVNRTFLLLAKYVGNVINADSFAWLPGKNIVGSQYFNEALETYINKGIFPVLIQISFKTEAPGIFRSVGLSYFADQEIELITPRDFPRNEAIKRMVRIVDDIVENGKIKARLESKGLARGERIEFLPSGDGKTIHVSLSV